MFELFRGMQPGMPLTALHGKIKQDRRTMVFQDFIRYAILFYFLYRLFHFILVAVRAILCFCSYFVFCFIWCFLCGSTLPLPVLHGTVHFCATWYNELYLIVPIITVFFIRNSTFYIMWCIVIIIYTISSLSLSLSSPLLFQPTWYDMIWFILQAEGSMHVRHWHRI